MDRVRRFRGLAQHLRSSAMDLIILLSLKRAPTSVACSYELFRLYFQLIAQLSSRCNQCEGAFAIFVTILEDWIDPLLDRAAKVVVVPVSQFATVRFAVLGILNSHQST